MADRRHRLACFVYCADKAEYSLVGTQRVRIDDPSRQHQGIEAGRIGLIQRNIHCNGVAPVLLFPALDRRLLCRRHDADARAFGFQQPLGFGQFGLFKAVGGKDGNLLALQSFCHGCTPVGGADRMEERPLQGSDPAVHGRWRAPGGAGALGRAAAALPDLLQLGSVTLGQSDAVVVGQFLAGRDVTQRLDEHLVTAAVAVLVFLDHGLAVRLAAVVDPARVIAFVVGIDHPVVVEGEQEGVAAFDVAAVIGINIAVAAQQALVLDHALALLDRGHGEHAVAMDGGLAGLDLLRHRHGLFAADGTWILAHSG